MSGAPLEPMLATPWPHPFSDEGWVFEPKWDGVRILASRVSGETRLHTRRGIEVSARYPEVVPGGLDEPAVVDGEIVALDGDGLPSFERLQQRMHLIAPRAIAAAARTTPVTFVAFDVLRSGGWILGEPLEERRSLLARLEETPAVAVSQAVIADGAVLWEAITTRGLEGMVAKRLGSRYRPGVRSPDWRKIADIRHLRAVVGGYTSGSGWRAGGFGALVLGLWDGPLLRWIGNVGTPFTAAEVTVITEALADLEAPVAPFLPDAALPPARWVQPRLVVSIGFREWTGAGRLRHPRFRGFTDDPADTVTWETEGPRPRP